MESSLDLKLSRYHVVTPPVLDQAAKRHVRLVFATRTATARVIDAASWADVEAGRFEALPGAIRDDLVADELLVPAAEQELDTVLSRNAAAIGADDTHYIVIQPTAMCQLGCDYCGQSHTSRQLSEADQDRLVERVATEVAQRKGLRTLFVSWFGGEPLLGLTVMRRLTPRFQAIAAAHGLHYEAKMISNGLALGPALAAELLGELAVRQIEITLDGDSAHHDARRGKKSGAPTFARIVENIVHLANRPETPKKISVRCNVDRRNAGSVSELIRLLAAKGLQGKIEFYAASVYSWGNDAHLRSLTAEEFAAAEIGWFVEQSTLGFRPAVLPTRKPVVCMAVMPESRLFDAYGNMFTCTEVSYVADYGVPNRYSVGTLAGGDDAPAVDLADFNSRIAAGTLPCTSCRMLPVCGGSCPKKWLEAHEPCPSAKRNIEQRLLLGYALARREQEAIQEPAAAQAA